MLRLTETCQRDAGLFDVSHCTGGNRVMKPARGARGTYDVGRRVCRRANRALWQGWAGRMLCLDVCKGNVTVGGDGDDVFGDARSDGRSP